jgi:hypothetical protein
MHPTAFSAALLPHQHAVMFCLQADEATLAVMQRHLLRSTGTDALDCILSWCKWEFGEQEPPPAAAAASEAGAAAASAAVVSFSSAAERAALVKSLPPEVGQPLGKALEAVNGADVQVSVCLVTQLLCCFVSAVFIVFATYAVGYAQGCAEVGQPLGKALEAVNGAPKK